jgi:hypothetical protein
MRFRVRAVSLLIAVLLLASGAQAQHRWNGKEKHWYKDWLWWVGEGVIVTAFVLDAHSTALVRDRCPGCRETNPLLGPHPTIRAIVLDSTLLFAFATGLHIGSWETCPDPNWDDKPWRTACYALVPSVAAFKFPAAVHNYQIAAQHKTSSLHSVSTSLLRPMPSSVSGAQFGAHELTMRSYPNSFLPKQFSGISLRPNAEAKRDLRSVQFK